MEQAWQLLLVHDAGYGDVDLVVPLACCVSESCVGSPVAQHVLVQIGDLGFHGRVLAWHGHTEIGLWANLIQVRDCQKACVLALQDQLIGLGVRRKGHPGLSRDYQRLDGGHSSLPGYRHAVVTVGDKVGITNLNDLNGW